MKKPSLAAALQPLDTKASIPQPLVEPPVRKPPTGQQPGRVGKKPLIGYFSPECMKQFKQITLDRDTTQQDLLAEALNDLFQKYGKPTLA
jgi:hypothetical protein